MLKELQVRYAPKLTRKWYIDSQDFVLDVLVRHSEFDRDRAKKREEYALHPAATASVPSWRTKKRTAARYHLLDQREPETNTSSRTGQEGWECERWHFSSAFRDCQA